jgi:molybdopterin converting factor small subunit
MQAQDGAVCVRIPAQLRRLYGTQARESVQADSVTALVHALDARYPGIGARLMEPDGHMRRWVNVFVGSEDIRALGGEATPLRPGDEVSIVPSVAGGTAGGQRASELVG